MLRMETKITDLPVEILGMIGEKCEIFDIVNFALTCKKAHYAMTKSEFKPRTNLSIQKIHDYEEKIDNLCDIEDNIINNINWVFERCVQENSFTKILFWARRQHKMSDRLQKVTENRTALSDEYFKYIGDIELFFLLLKPIKANTCNSKNIVCECGVVLLKSSLKKHLLTAKHERLMKLKQE